MSELTYQSFLEQKTKTHITSGFDANLNENYLFEFQNWVVNRALAKGKYTVSSGTGTGKTRMQISWANEVLKHTGKSVLILAPLVVSSQTIAEGEKIGIKVKKYSDLALSEIGIYISNYDQLDNIKCEIFSGIALDEGSILKNHEGAYRNLIIEKFKKTPYKSVWSATIAPNDPMEIGNYSEFLDILSRSEMLAMYFVHDGGETAKWRLKKHAYKRFWEWVSTWCVMFQNPKDINFNQEGYELPPLNLIEKTIVTDKRDNGKLFNDTAVSATTFNSELRLTRSERLKIAADLATSNDEQYIIWIKQNEEGDVLKKLIPNSVDVRGSDSNEIKEKNLLAFANGELRVLITKSKIAGMGMNFQSCHNQIFASLDFSFESVYQSIRRSLRYGQKYPVNIWLITTDTMSNIPQTYFKKQEQFFNMQSEMTKAVNANINNVILSDKDYDSTEVKNDWFHIKRGDSCQLIKEIESESIGISVFSPPFVDLYTYSDHIEDMGNSNTYDEFVTHFNFLVSELFRIMISGRNVCVHCMDLPIQKGKHGFIGLRDFSGTILKIFEDNGFIYHSRVTIWKDPVVEMQRTKALGLLHKQVKKDSTMSRVGIPDYVLIFRKDGERNNPVTNKDMSVDLWQKYASPVWMDIDYGDTLQGFRNGRDEKDEKHICPLQLPTIERLIHLYSNPGDTLFTPFMGIGSEVYQAVKMNRKGIGFELKESYYSLAVTNCNVAVEQKKQLSLFDNQ